MLELAGRGAIIAGTKRIGATVVKRLVREGIRPAIVYRSSRDEAEALYESVRDDAGRAVIIQADLAVESDVQRAVETAKRDLGDLSFCINLASDFPRVPFEQLDAAAWERGMASAKGAYLLGLHCARAMQSNAGPTRGHIVFFGDWAAGETPYVDYVPYLTAKAGVLFMTRGFALELAPYGILVNAISPGPTAAPPPEHGNWDEALALAPLHRESSQDEMAELIATILRFETMTGENIRIDSGRHIAGGGLPEPRAG
jgi:pteridine reductase